MMTNREFIKTLLNMPMDAPVFIWTESGLRELTNPTTSDSIPDWQKEKVNLPQDAIIFPV